VDADPLYDLERRLERLASRLDLSNQAIRSEVDGMRDDIKRMEAEVVARVPLYRYLTVEKIVFGMVGFILLGFMTALIAVVVK
jgi:phytoene/squalene synthetase